MLHFLSKDNLYSVTLTCQDPVLANGRITRFDIKIEDQKDKVKNGSLGWESVLVNRSEADSRSSQRKITTLKKIHIADKKSIQAFVTASNSVGKSPEASLFIPEKALGKLLCLQATP